MNWKNSFLWLGLVLALGCSDKKLVVDAKVSSEGITRTASASKYLMEAEELLPLLNTENLKIIDFRKEEVYLESHITGAIHLWRDHIEDHTYPYKGMMATKDSIAELLGNLGISDSDLLVVYDNRGSCDAARFWWVMQNFDFENVRILNGGLKAWLAANGGVTAVVVPRDATVFHLPEHPSPRYLIEEEELRDILSVNGPEILIDTRTHDEFTGKRKKTGASHGGRIPGSRQIDWTTAIDYHGSLKFKSKEELDNIYGTLNVSKDHPIITYCHTGVRSALTTFVLTQLLDYKNVRNYDGSWTEWSYQKNLPFEQDSVTTILN